MVTGKKKAWYYTGKDAEAVEKRLAAEQKVRQEQIKNRVHRFRQGHDESSKLVCLDSPILGLFEHQIEIDGNFYNYFTCISDIDTCPVCESGEKPYFARVCTVISPKGYLDREGTQHKNQKMLLVAKSEARERLKKLLAKEGDLKYRVLEATRGNNQKEVATGAQFDVLGKTTLEKIKALCPKDFEGGPAAFIKPFDYEKVFAPKPSAELRKLLGLAHPVGSSEEEEEDEPGLELEEESSESEGEEEVSDDDTSLEDLL